MQGITPDNLRLVGDGAMPPTLALRSGLLSNVLLSPLHFEHSLGCDTPYTPVVQVEHQVFSNCGMTGVTITLRVPGSGELSSTVFMVAVVW